MPEIDGGFLLLVVSIVPLMYFAKYLWENWREIVRYDDSRKGRVVRAWLKAKPGTQAKIKAERVLDKLVVRDMNRAATPCELYNACERGLTYSTWYGKQKRREITPTICSAHSTKFNNLKKIIEEERVARGQERRRSTGNSKAPYLEKIDRRQSPVESVCYYNSLYKNKVSPSVTVENVSNQVH